MTSRVLLTGGAGFIGSQIADQLIEAGYDVAIVDNLSTGRRQNLNPKARFYNVDLCSSQVEEVFDRERPHLVSHHAAQISVQASMDNPQNDAATNVLGSLHVLELCRRYGVRKVIYGSTGGALYGEPQYLPCDEGHPVRPVSAYGISKYAVELYLPVYKDTFDLDYTILRYGNVYGPRQDPHGEAGVVAIFSQRMLGGDPCFIYGTGEQQRDFVYVEDVAAANLIAMETASGKAINIGTGMGASVNQVFDGLAEAIGYQGAPVHRDSRPGEVHSIHLDNSLARHELGWQPTVTLPQGLEKTAAYFRQAASGGQISQVAG
ncbi:MAG: UDP-glucose 4-epimerase [Chloroflexi bacterium]|jgi:UDP-glucose 4-epimerase|nr:MAG: UDP-glucose 4-epimerase [Chloroflexota bacterium]